MNSDNVKGPLAAVIIVTIALVSVATVFVSDMSDTPDQIKIQISGSTTCLPILEECALKYMESNNVSIFVSGGGSSAGIKAVSDGISDIGMASRDLKSEELPGMIVTTIARDSIAIIVNPDNPIDDITKDAIQRIYTGKTINFDYIGGNDEAIMVVTREAGSGTRSTFEKLVMDKNEITDTAIVVSSNGILRSTVSGSDVAIGYISAGYVDETVKELNVDMNIGRNLYLITGENPSPEITAFIDFILSEIGQDIVEEVGFTKV